jgi:hypothetical protein
MSIQACVVNGSMARPVLERAELLEIVTQEPSLRPRTSGGMDIRVRHMLSSTTSTKEVPV